MREAIRDHWDKTYSGKSEGQVSWHQDEPQPSLDLILEGRVAAQLGVIDVGAGRSRLAKALFDRGCRDITLLDISQTSLEAAAQRLKGADPILVNADITHWTPARSWDVWHDRAVFHFLTRPEDRAAYVTALLSGTKPGSRVVMATFAEDGPERCSGFPVERYSRDRLSEVLGPSFEPRHSFKVQHITPMGGEQTFRYTTFNRGTDRR